VIDWNRVHDLREEVGSEVFPEVILMFFEEADEVIARLGAGTDGNDLVADLHLLRGSAANLGFDALARLCAAAEAGAGGDASVMIESILRCYRLSREAFQKRVAEPAWA
jgi:hypothetical protein